MITKVSSIVIIIMHSLVFTW